MADVTQGVHELIAVAASLNRDWKLVDALIRTIADFIESMQGADAQDGGSRVGNLSDQPHRQPTEDASTEHGISPVFKARVEAVMDSLSDDEAAWFLKVGLRQVRRRAQQGSLFFFRVGVRRRYPLWQFGNRKVLSGAPDVIRWIPTDWPAERVHRFMTTFESGLDIHGEPFTPSEWLLAGNDPSRIVALLQNEARESSDGTHGSAPR